MGIIVKAVFWDCDEKLFSSLGKIFWIRVEGDGSDEIDGQKVAESVIIVGNMDLSVVVFYSLVLVRFSYLL